MTWVYKARAMPRRRVSIRLRRQVVAQAKGLCEYCRTPEDFSPTLFVVEHIVPEAKGGETALANSALACHQCNGHRGTRQNILIRSRANPSRYSIRAATNGKFTSGGMMITRKL